MSADVPGGDGFRHLLTALVTAGILGAGNVVWSLVRPEPQADRERAVADALLRKEVGDLRVGFEKHDALLVKAIPQLQRIEDALTQMRDEYEPKGTQRAGAKR